MRVASISLAIGLPLSALLLATVIFGGGIVGAASSAQAQASLTPPAGQPRITAPGGLRGRAAHRHKRYRHRR